MNESTRQHHPNLRIILVGMVFLVWFLTIGARAIYLQVFCYDDLSQRASDEYEKSIVTQGKRGVIYDSRQRVLAISVDAVSIAAFPKRIENITITANALAKILNIKAKVLKYKLESGKKFVWIKRVVTPKEEAAVKELQLKGIEFVPEHTRVYPNKTLASQVIGYTGIDGVGLEGIEYQFESMLKGDSGEFTVLKDALGRKFDMEKPVPPSFSGKNIVLTLDAWVQYFTEKALEEGILTNDAKSGMAIVMVPQTGAILAMANYPPFNPNTYDKFPMDVRRNRIVTDAFEPGSTMKIFSAAAAIESKICHAETMFYCENGKYKIGNNTIHDTKPYGWLSLQKIVKHSSNIGAIKISETIGPERLFKTLNDFGFGKRTGIDCPAETPGRLTSYSKWSRSDASVISFGYGISVSAVQLITAVSAIANDGLLMKPYIVRSISDPNGRMVQSFLPRPLRQVISKETAHTMKLILKTTVEEGGTGVKAAIDGYSICGKTGTAKKVGRSGEYSEGKYLSSFVGFFPMEQPQVAILVVVDEPKEQYYGGHVAAPIFRQIAYEIIRYMNIKPEIKQETLTVSNMKSLNG